MGAKLYVSKVEISLYHVTKCPLSEAGRPEWMDSELSGYDACFFCLGTSSAGLSEQEYRHVTYDITLAAGRTLARLNPQMTFIYVSGGGTDSSESGGTMWARVKGQTENALLALPFKAAYMLRPGVIQPMHDSRYQRGQRIRSKRYCPVLICVHTRVRIRSYSGPSSAGRYSRTLNSGDG
jgi:uncharacterized protein YbjT (DUF2867 family)